VTCVSLEAAWGAAQLKRPSGAGLEVVWTVAIGASIMRQPLTVVI